MPSKINCVPAGFEFSGSEDEDDYYATPKIVKKVEKTPLQLKKERLLNAIIQNDLDLLRDEMNKPPKGFDIDEIIDGRWNCLYLACFRALPEIVEYLLEERGAYANLEDGSDTPLIIACSSEADSEQVLKVVHLLINKSANFRISNAFGVTPIMQACLRGHLEVVKLLLASGESLDTVDNEGKNLLFFAIDGKQLEVARFLISKGIDLNHVNTYRVSAKEHAVNENQLEILELFPQEVPVYQPPVNYMNYNRFEELVPTSGSDVPAYFPDVATLLNGMRCERYIPHFAQARVSLEEFLTISDERLKEIGVRLPFHRKLIQEGLTELVLKEGSWESLYNPIKVPIKELSYFDVVMILADMHRQMVVINAHLYWVQRFCPKEDSLKAQKDFDKKKELLKELLKKFAGSLNSFQKLIKETYCKHPVTRPLLISKNKKTSNWSSFKLATLTALPFVPIANNSLPELNGCEVKFKLQSRRIFVM